MVFYSKPPKEVKTSFGGLALLVYNTYSKPLLGVWLFLPIAFLLVFYCFSFSKTSRFLKRMIRDYLITSFTYYLPSKNNRDLKGVYSRKI